MLTVSSIISKASSNNLIETEVDSEVVMLRLDTDTCYGLNKVGSAIWHMIETPTSVVDICKALCIRYDVDEETCRAQVMDLLIDMQSENCITVTEVDQPTKSLTEA